MQRCQEKEKTPSEAERERPAVPATCCSRRETHQSDAGIFALGGRGIAASRRRGAKGDRTPRFPIPSCDSPTFLWPLSVASRLKRGGRNENRPIIFNGLPPIGAGFARLSAHTSARQRVQGGWIEGGLHDLFRRPAGYITI